MKIVNKTVCKFALLQIHYIAETPEMMYPGMWTFDYQILVDQAIVQEKLQYCRSLWP